MQQDQFTGRKLSTRFESQFDMKQDVEVSVYLRKVAQSLADVAPELKQSPVGVFLIQSRNPESRLRSFALPGNRIYVSIPLLRGLEFENEVAGVIAVQLGHVMKRHALAHFEALSRPQGANAPLVKDELSAADYFGKEGIFAFTEEERIEAYQAAVKLLYLAGYDPRGLVSVLERHERDAKRSPADARAFERIATATRQEIARFSPLRNPIIRTEAFVKAQKRIRKL